MGKGYEKAHHKIGVRQPVNLWKDASNHKMQFPVMKQYFTLSDLKETRKSDNMRIRDSTTVQTLWDYNFNSFFRVQFDNVCRVKKAYVL